MIPERITVHLRKVSPVKGTKVRLFAMGVDGREVTPHMGEWDLDAYERDSLPDLSAEIFQTAQFDCDEGTHPKKYRAMAIGKGGDQLRQWTMTQMPDPTARPEQAERQAAGLQLEEPSVQGFAAMNMRHTERAMDLLLTGNERTIRNLLAQNEQLAKRVLELEKREADVMELARSVYERAGNEVASERNAERLDKGLELLTKVAAAAGVQLGILPQGFDPSADAGAVAKLAQTALQGANGKAAESSSSAPVAPPVPEPAADGAAS